jgi:tRNA A-37 threonylcarbamoyl transferase component Bud32
MLSSLQNLHAEGYIHRDVKLENFCVRQTRAAPLEVCLIDFGLVMDYVTNEEDFKEDAFEPFLGNGIV